MEADQVRELFDYDETTGILRWRISIGPCRIGSVAGTPHSNGRYLYVRYKGKEYANHRLAFAWMEGRWPDPEVDHWDTDGFNNRWKNLREATKAQNAQNRKVRVNNKVGLKGVIVVERFGIEKFEARIRIDGKQKHLGRFETAQEAHAAYVTAAEAYHKQFARS